MTFSYHAYGLTIQSELECPELLTLEPTDKYDISIHMAEIPEALENATHTTPNVQVRDETCQINIEDIARFRTIAGNTILVHPIAGVDLANVRLFLLGTVFGTLIHQRGMLPLHAGAVACNGRAYAFCGYSGAGKSTLCKALQQHDFKLMCDDTGVLVPGRDETLFYPGFPRIKLWQDALDHFNVDTGDLIRDQSRTDKFHLLIHDTFHAEPLPLDSVFLLSRSEIQQTASIQTVTGVEKMRALATQTYRPRMISHLKRHKYHFDLCSRIANNINMFEYSRPWDLDQLEENLPVLINNINKTR